MAQKEEVYIMEKILDKRISRKDGKLEYLIAWENFGPEDNTWEPQSNIFCPVMLKNFEKRRAAEKRLVMSLPNNFNIQSGLTVLFQRYPRYFIALFVTSKIEFSNAPILEFKVLQNAFKIKKNKA